MSFEGDRKTFSYEEDRKQWKKETRHDSELAYLIKKYVRASAQKKPAQITELDQPFQVNVDVLGLALFWVAFLSLTQINR